MRVNFDIGFKVKKIERETYPTDKDIVENLVVGSVQALHPALNGTDSRIFARIQGKLFDADGHLDLERTELEWVIEKLEKAPLPPGFSMWRWTLIDHLKGISEAEASPKQ